MTSDLQDYDPDPHDRQWFRQARDGQLGWMVRRNGQDYIRLDRPQQEILRPYRKSEWIAEEEIRPMTRAQLAQVAFEADRALCRFLGDHGQAKAEWLSLRDEARRTWIEEGPSSRLERRKLYQAIMIALGEFAR